MPKNNITLEVEKLRKEFYEGMRELRKQQKQTDKQLGRFVNSFGEFVEYLAAPSIPKVMAKQGIKVINYAQNALSRRNGNAMEIDVLAYGVTRKNEDVMLLVEIKSTVTPQDVDELITELKTFPVFFPEYKKMMRVGIVAGVKFPVDVARYAEKSGLYALAPSGEILRVLNTKTFKPKVWT